jgi:ABC-2 type transport system permease protein/lipopolysaccharide transport system permease protein
MQTYRAMPGGTGISHRWIAGQHYTLGHDLYEGLRAWPMWSSLGWHDIRQRYRRSVLGPLWITLSMGVLVGTLGTIYSRVFHADIASYLPYLCAGFVIWGFISSSATESCTIFMESAALIKQTKVPFSIHVLRVLWRNFIVFLHTVIIFLPLALWFGIEPHFTALLALPGLLLLYVSAMWMGLVLAILGARFRDVPWVVTNLLQVAFFSTPIMWQANALGDDPLMAELNPLYHLIELVRAPLLGQQPEPLSWLVAAALIVLGAIGTMALFRRVSQQIVYWL